MLSVPDSPVSGFRLSESGSSFMGFEELAVVSGCSVFEFEKSSLALVAGSSC